MIIAFAFLLPCLLYFALYFFISRYGLFPRKHLGIASLIGSLVVATVSAGVVLHTLVKAPHWPGRTQLAWMGVEVAGQPLVIGGAREQAAYAWPNESFAPSLKASAASETAAALEISGGEAFIRDDQRGVFLNGASIPDGETKELGDFKVRVEPSYYFWRNVEVIGEDGEVWASVSMPAVQIKRDRVYSLAALVDKNATETRRDDVKSMLRLERWAEGFRLLVPRDGEIRLLDATTQNAQCELPCELSVLWTHRRIPIKLSKEGVKLRADFLPTRLLVSPLLPSEEGDGWTPLMVTGTPLPGDRAFFLPLGQGVSDVRQSLVFKNNAKGLPVFDMPTAIVFGEGGVPELPAYMQPRVSELESEEKNITSRVALHSPPHSFHFATINDLPNFSLIGRLLLYALICFGLGLWVAYNRMPNDKTRWMLYGLATIVWNLLAFRLLLAFRYALSPVSLDLLALKGVRLAFVALTVAPGVLLLFVRLRRDLFEPFDEGNRRKRTLRGTLVFFFTLVAFGAVAYTQSPDIWANPPARPSSLLNYLWFAALSLIVIYLSLLIFMFYKIEPARSRAQRKAAAFFFWPLQVLEYISKAGKGIWTRAKSEEIAKKWNWPMRLAFALSIISLLILGLPFISLLIALTSAMISKLVSFDTFMHDLVMPFLFYWPLAFTLLAAKLVFPAGSKLTSMLRVHKNAALRRRMIRIFLVVLFSVGTMVFLAPAAIGDAGSIMGILSIMIPTAFVLMAARPRRWGALVGLALLSGFAVAAYAYVNIRSVAPALPSVASVAASRILVFKEYGRLQSILPFEEKGRLQKLRDGYQHTWENQAIAHEGGYGGLGFGYAPTQRSQVRQDTIQYDSVFSFFIAAEYGLFGGVCLLLLYAMPLAFILVGGRSRFDFGYAVATVIASSFILEALIHAGMNYNLFPFTGRDLPLLTVNSFTDLLRWMILFGLAAQATLYRYRGKNSLRADEDSFLSKGGEDATQEPLTSYLPATGWIVAAPAIILAAIVWTGVQIIKDKKLDEPFSWAGILDIVDVMGREGFLYVKDDKTLHIRPEIPTSPGMLIEQERARFNALPEEERMEIASLEKYKPALLSAGSVESYDLALDQMRQDLPSESARRNASLFKLLPPLLWDDGKKLREVGGMRVVANRALNVQLSFKTGFKEEEFPLTKLRDGRTLVGPAWIAGRWVQLYDPAPAVPWTAHLSGALKGEWARLGKDDAAKTFGRLSLHGHLQERASAFASVKGRELHAQLLSNSVAQAQIGEKLPPRVAISILGLPTGEALALGGWPRMNASRSWRRGSDGKEWIPPADWVERVAPAQLRTLYGGDRNFDSLVMGSATKPLWAAAALRVHPQLDKKLQTRGPEAVETDVFGIQLVDDADDGWAVGGRDDWVDFKNYLSKSDNRYHVRLGFLALSEKIGGDVLEEAASTSEKESLKGRPPAAWRRSPRFPPEINFSHQQPKSIMRLNETPLARHMLNMFGVGATQNYFDRKVSFWTKNQEDDLARPPGRDRSDSIFKFISPASVDLSLERIANPRDYVTLLLGGGTNLWSNADFAAAFATCLTGRPVLAHVVKNESPMKFVSEREEFVGIAQSLRPGLAAVVTEGTANLPELRNALAPFQKQGYMVYAKTGTLAPHEGARTTSRIVLAIVKWDNEAQGKIKTGIVFSVVGERAGVGAATQWLGEFLSGNRTEIEKLLKELAG